MPSNKPHGIVLFDGVCNLCDASVQFIMKRDRADYFRFAPLQLETGRRIMAEHGYAPGKLESLVLYENERIYTRSTAALRIARRLSGAWPILYVFIVIPLPIRDAVYALLARNRYWLFGKKETCEVPTSAQRKKFL